MSDHFNDYQILMNGIHNTVISNTEFIRTSEFAVQLFRHDIGEVLLQPKNLVDYPLGKNSINLRKIP